MGGLLFFWGCTDTDFEYGCLAGTQKVVGVAENLFLSQNLAGLVATIPTTTKWCECDVVSKRVHDTPPI